MDETPKLICKPNGKYGWLAFVLLIPLAIVLSIIGVFGLNKALQTDDPGIAAMWVPAGLIVMSILAIYFSLRARVLKLYDDRLEVVSLFGKLKRTIQIKDVTRWQEEENKDENGKSWTLILFAASGNYKIQSSIYAENYKQLREVLTNGLEEDKIGQRATRLNYFKHISVGAAIAGFLLLGMAYYIFTAAKKMDPPPLLTTISGVALEKPDCSILHSRKGNSSNIFFKLQNFPHFLFDVKDMVWSEESMQSFRGTIPGTDTIYADIPTTIYESKLVKETRGGMFNKDADYNIENIYGLRSRGITYLTPEIRHGGEQEGNNRLIFEILFWAVLAFAGSITSYFAGRKIKLQENR